MVGQIVAEKRPPSIKITIGLPGTAQSFGIVLEITRVQPVNVIWGGRIMKERTIGVRTSNNRQTKLYSFGQIKFAKLFDPWVTKTSSIMLGTIPEHMHDIWIGMAATTGFGIGSSDVMQFGVRPTGHGNNPITDAPIVIIDGRVSFSFGQNTTQKLKINIRRVIEGGPRRTNISETRNTNKPTHKRIEKLEGG